MKTRETAEFLKRKSSFLTDLSKKVKFIDLNSGDILMRQGAPGSSLYVILDGRLRVSIEEEGRLPRILREIGRGESVGEMALLTGEPRSATIVAVRQSTVIELGATHIRQLLDRHPRLTLQLTQSIIERLKRVPNLSSIATVALVPVGKFAGFSSFVRRLRKGLSRYGKTLVVNERSVKRKFGSDFWSGSGEAKLVNWLTEEEAAHSLVVYQADPEATPWTLRCLRQADRVLLVADAHGDPSPGVLERELFFPGSEVTDALVDLVLVRSGRAARPRNTLAWLETRKIHQHYHVAEDNDGDCERLARILTGNCITLVLSGGGAKGFAHVGVLRALKEADVPVDAVGGTSMGSVVALGAALEFDTEKIVDCLRRYLVRGRGVRDYTFPFVSLLTGSRLKRGLKAMCEGARIEDLTLGFFCVSTNLRTADIEVHRRGFLWKAVRASVSIPGIFAPVLSGDDWLVDGGVLNNLPVDVMSRMFPGRIIAVDVGARKKATFRDRFPSAVSGWRLLWRRFNPFLGTQDLPTILDTVTRSTEVATVNLQNNILKNHAMDVYARPPVVHFNMLDAEALDDIVEIGYDYASSQMEEWKKRLGL